MEVNIYWPLMTKREEKLPFYIMTIGSTAVEKRIYRPGGISAFQILYTEDGEGSVRLFDKEMSAVKGTILFLPPNTPHDYYMSGNTWRTKWITFGGWGAEQLFDIEAGVIDLPEDYDFIDRFNEIEKYSIGDKWIYKRSALLYSVLLECRDYADKNIKPIYKLRDKLDECFDFIDNNYGSEIELETLAEICHMSREHFCRVFKSYTGMRPFEYIKNYRIQRSKELLVRYKNIKVCKIGEMSGFRSGSYFSAEFKKNAGCTPDEYRKNSSVV